VALPDRWITDTELSPRFPYYTRANADEVGPEPFTPLGWTLGWVEGCIPGVADGFVEFGVIRRDELVLDPAEVFGCWGGYFYNQLSLTRVMGARMPGASPAAIDAAYFGDHPGVPPYHPHPDDEDEVQAAKLGETMAWAMSTDSYPLMEQHAKLAEDARAGRPDLARLTDAELVAHGRDLATKVRDAWVPYCVVCLAASLGPGAVQAACAALGRPQDAVTLLSGFGDVASATGTASEPASQRATTRTRSRSAPRSTSCSPTTATAVPTSGTSGRRAGTSTRRSPSG
jgi:rifampicin phosphotransferase